MVTPKKITQKEFKGYVDQQMVAKGFTSAERDAVHSAFSGDVNDVDAEEPRPLFSSPQPGITQTEFEQRMSNLRDPNSDLSKGLKTQLHPQKLDQLGEILNEALEKDKDNGWL